MCLTIKDKIYRCRQSAKRAEKTLKPKKATHDILVFKLLTPELKSPYKNFQYTLGKEFSAKIVKKMNPSWGEFAIVVNEGLHAWRTGERAQNLSCNSRKCYPAIIPKGALYYIGDNDDIVSNKLIVYNNLDDLQDARNSDEPYLTFHD